MSLQKKLIKRPRHVKVHKTPFIRLRQQLERRDLILNERREYTANLFVLQPYHLEDGIPLELVPLRGVFMDTLVRNDAFFSRNFIAQFQNINQVDKYQFISSVINEVYKNMTFAREDRSEMYAYFRGILMTSLEIGIASLRYRNIYDRIIYPGRRGNMPEYAINPNIFLFHNFDFNERDNIYQYQYNEPFYFNMSWNEQISPLIELDHVMVYFLIDKIFSLYLSIFHRHPNLNPFYLDRYNFQITIEGEQPFVAFTIQAQKTITNPVHFSQDLGYNQYHQNPLLFYNRHRGVQLQPNFQNTLISHYDANITTNPKAIAYFYYLAYNSVKTLLDKIYQHLRRSHRSERYGGEEGVNIGMDSLYRSLNADNSPFAITDMNITISKTYMRKSEKTFLQEIFQGLFLKDSYTLKVFSNHLIEEQLLPFHIRTLKHCVLRSILISEMIILGEKKTKEATSKVIENFLTYLPQRIRNSNCNNGELCPLLQSSNHINTFHPSDLEFLLKHYFQYHSRYNIQPLKIIRYHITLNPERYDRIITPSETIVHGPWRETNPILYFITTTSHIIPLIPQIEKFDKAHLYLHIGVDLFLNEKIIPYRKGYIEINNESEEINEEEKNLNNPTLAEREKKSLIVAYDIETINQNSRNDGLDGEVIPFVIAVTSKLGNKTFVGDNCFQLFFTYLKNKIFAIYDLVYLYAHNGSGFDHRMLLMDYLRHFNDNRVYHTNFKLKNNRLIIFQFLILYPKQGNVKTTFICRDTFLFFPIGLERLAASMGLKGKKDPTIFEDYTSLGDLYENNNRTLFHGIIDYCLQDAVLLYQIIFAMRKYYGLIADVIYQEEPGIHGMLPIENFMGLTTYAKALFFTPPFYNLENFPIYTTSLFVDEMLRQAYTGGRVEALYQGIVKVGDTFPSPLLSEVKDIRENPLKIEDFDYCNPETLNKNRYLTLGYLDLQVLTCIEKDADSEYPSAMAHNLLPYGPSTIETTDFRNRDELMSNHYVWAEEVTLILPRTDNLFPPLPVKQKINANDKEKLIFAWYEVPTKVWITHVEWYGIFHLFHYPGARITKTHRRVYWKGNYQFRKFIIKAYQIKLSYKKKIIRNQNILIGLHGPQPNSIYSYIKNEEHKLLNLDEVEKRSKEKLATYKAIYDMSKAIVNITYGYWAIKTKSNDYSIVPDKDMRNIYNTFMDTHIIKYSKKLEGFRSLVIKYETLFLTSKRAIEISLFTARLSHFQLLCTMNDTRHNLIQNEICIINENQIKIKKEDIQYPFNYIKNDKTFQYNKETKTFINLKTQTILQTTGITYSPLSICLYTDTDSVKTSEVYSPYRNILPIEPLKIWNLEKELNATPFNQTLFSPTPKRDVNRSCFENHPTRGATPHLLGWSDEHAYSISSFIFLTLKVYCVVTIDGDITIKSKGINQRLRFLRKEYCLENGEFIIKLHTVRTLKWFNRARSVLKRRFGLISKEEYEEQVPLVIRKVKNITPITSTFFENGVSFLTPKQKHNLAYHLQERQIRPRKLTKHDFTYLSREYRGKLQTTTYQFSFPALSLFKENEVFTRDIRQKTYSFEINKGIVNDFHHVIPFVIS